jgi:hypothetical protein
VKGYCQHWRMNKCENFEAALLITTVLKVDGLPYTYLNPSNLQLPNSTSQPQEGWNSRNRFAID